MKKLIIKLLVIISMFTCVFTVNAKTGILFTVGYAEGSEGKGKVLYSTNDGENWVDASSSATPVYLDPSIKSFKIRVLANEYYETAFETGPLLETGPSGSPVNFHAGDMDKERTLLTGDGYPVTITDGLQTISLTNIKFNESTSKKTSNVSVDITGPGLEYWNGDYPSRINFFINTPQGENEEQFIKLGGSDNLEWKGDYEINGIFVKNADGVSTKKPVEATYDYDGKGFVTILVGISNASTKITSFVVNGVDYADQCPQSDKEFLESLNDARAVGFEIKNVAYSDNYDIKIVAEFNDLMGGFGWNYLPEESQSGDTREDCIAHGTLEFIQGEYEGMVFDSVDAWNDYKYNGISHIFEWHDGDKNYKDEKDAWGSAAFPRDAKITMKLIPDPGYQLVSLYGDKNIKAENEPGVYTITMTGGMNSHLMATFKKTDNETKTSHSFVDDGSINIMENKIEDLVDNGTIRLNIEETNISAKSETEFKAEADAQEAKIETYLDINLDNIIHKANASSDDAWLTTKDLSTLAKPAEISITLEKPIDGEVVVLHETHNGDIEVLDARVDGNIVYFETTSFSNYALGFKNSDDPETGKDIIEREYDCEENLINENKIHLNEGDSYNDIAYEDIEDGQVFDIYPSEEECKLPQKNKQELFTEDKKYGVEFDDYDANYGLEILSVLNLSPEELEELGVSQEEYDEVKKLILDDLLKDEKDIIDVFVSNLYDADKRGKPVPGEDDEYYDGLIWPDKIVFKAKLVDGYDSYKLICLDEGLYDGEIEEFIGTIKDGYVYFDVDYASGTFALIGDYKFACTKGHNQIWTKGSNSSLEFTFKRSAKDEMTFDSYDYIDIDGNKVDVKVSKGSLIVSLSKDDLSKLSVGNHVITAHFNDGKSSSASFVIIENNNNKNQDNRDVPNTGVK